MYLIYCAIAFYIISNLSKNKVEWFILSVLCFLLYCNKEYFNNTDDALYYVRGFLCFTAAYLLSKNLTKLGLYQAFMQFLVLSVYAALAYDVANNKHILIYNNFEGAIHGLVICQFIGVIPEIWNFCRDIYTVNISRYKYYKGIQKI